MSDYENLPRVDYEQDAEGVLRPIDPDAAKVPHIIMWGGGPAGILRPKTATTPRTVECGGVTVIS